MATLVSYFCQSWRKVHWCVIGFFFGGNKKGLLNFIRNKVWVTRLSVYHWLVVWNKEFCEGFQQLLKYENSIFDCLPKFWRGLRGVAPWVLLRMIISTFIILESVFWVTEDVWIFDICVVNRIKTQEKPNQVIKQNWTIKIN